MSKGQLKNLPEEKVEEMHEQLAVVDTDNISKTVSPELYYGVYIPSATDELSTAVGSANNHVDRGDVQTVFTDKQEALKAVKKFRGARFKSFRTLEEATHFSKRPAEYFAINPHLSIKLPATTDTSESVNQEKGNTFRAPKPQELVRLRKVIESGNAESFSQTVWSNPRYLISGGDTPTILQEGPRYNALHIVAKAKQVAMCRVILDTIEDIKFMQLLYVDDSQSTLVSRVNFLVDLYLNMPDKALCETPLHFATKFGCLEIAEMLTSHPCCDRQALNKYQNSPKDVTCTRIPACLELKRQIEEAIEDHYFVPVIVAADNSQQPFIGQPWSPSKTSQNVASPIGDNGKNLLASAPIVRAYAGPMSPKKAKELYVKWKSPSCLRSSTPLLDGQKRLMGIRLSDTEKGLERIGRELAKEQNIPWAEQWSFLSTYCDIASAEGLAKLETYLRNKYNEMTSEIKSEAFEDIESLDLSAISLNDSSAGSVFEDHESLATSLDSICQMFGKLHINSELSLTPTSAQIVDNTRNVMHKNCSTDQQSSHAQFCHKMANDFDHVCLDIANKVTDTLYEQTLLIIAGRLKSVTLKRDFIERITPSIECLLRASLDNSSKNSASQLPFGDEHRKVAQRVIQSLKDEFSEEIVVALGKMATNGTFAVISSDEDSAEDDFASYRGGFTRNSVPNATVLQHLRCIFKIIISLAKDNPAEVNCSCASTGLLEGDPAANKSQELCDRRDSDDVFSDDSTSTDTYITPPSSTVSSQNSSVGDARTPEEGLLVFITGLEPTKLDLDVYRALENCHVDHVRYPHTARWRHFVSSFTKEETDGWPTSPSLTSSRGMQSSRRRASLGSISTTSSPSLHVGPFTSIGLQ